MNRDEILRLFEAHREAEAARDIDAILETFAPNCFLETIPLGIGRLLHVRNGLQPSPPEGVLDLKAP